MKRSRHGGIATRTAQARQSRSAAGASAATTAEANHSDPVTGSQLTLARRRRGRHTCTQRLQAQATGRGYAACSYLAAPAITKNNNRSQSCAGMHETRAHELVGGGSSGARTWRRRCRGRNGLGGGPPSRGAVVPFIAQMSATSSVSAAIGVARSPVLVLLATKIQLYVNAMLRGRAELLTADEK